MTTIFDPDFPDRVYAAAEAARQSTNQQRQRPDAREALRALGGEPCVAATNWTAAGRIRIDGHWWTVQVSDDSLAGQ